MVQIYWAGWDHMKWKFFQREKWSMDGVSLRGTTYLGPVHVSFYNVFRFGDA